MPAEPVLWPLMLLVSTRLPPSNPQTTNSSRQTHFLGRCLANQNVRHAPQSRYILHYLPPCVDIDCSELAWLSAFTRYRPVVGKSAGQSTRQTYQAGVSDHVVDVSLLGGP